MNAFRLMLVLMMVVSLAAEVRAGDIGTTLRELRARTDWGDPEQKRLVAERVRTEWRFTGVGDLPAVIEAMDDISLRGILLAVFEVATEDDLHAMVEHAASWVEPLESTDPVTREQRGLQGSARNFVLLLKQSGRWELATGGAHWLPLLEGTIASSVRYSGGFLDRGPAVRLWMETPMTAAAREASAIAIVERMRREDAPHEVSSAITSKVGRARLRDVLRDGNTLVTFHKGAASALAELGDQKALTVLQAIAPEITDSAPETARGARPRGPVGVIVEPYMRRIEIQKSPEHMLAFIARYDGIRDLTGAQIRVWAIGRALRMGIPHDDVREAVSAHLAATSAELAPGQARSPLRAAALELGLISDDEFENLRGYMPRRRLH